MVFLELYITIMGLSWCPHAFCFPCLSWKKHVMVWSPIPALSLSISCISPQEFIFVLYLLHNIIKLSIFVSHALQFLLEICYLFKQMRITRAAIILLKRIDCLPQADDLVMALLTSFNRYYVLRILGLLWFQRVYFFLVLLVLVLLYFSMLLDS
jgi:hypothetical protein